MKKLKEIIGDKDAYDILEYIVFLLSLFVASPYVYRQLSGLKNGLDIFWNVSFDLLVVIVGFLVIDLLKKLIKVYVNWVDRNS